MSVTKHSVSPGLSQLGLSEVNMGETDCVPILIPVVLVQHTNQKLTG